MQRFHTSALLLTASAALWLSACATEPESKASAPKNSDSAVATNQAAPQVAEVGALAPEFIFSDQAGNVHALHTFRGQPVVLEWFNEGCPTVQGLYENGQMQALQQKYTDQGVSWLTICSSGEGKQGFFAQSEAPALMTRMGMHSTALTRDPEGVVGRMFKAKTTPHMFVIDAEGRLVYDGAIDMKVAGQKENQVAKTLDALLAGQTVEPRATAPYGCGVKYAN